MIGIFYIITREFITAGDHFNTDQLAAHLLHCTKLASELLLQDHAPAYGFSVGFYYIPCYRPVNNKLQNIPHSTG